MRRTLGATVLTYAFVLLLTLGLPIVLFPVAIFAGPFFSYNNVPIEIQIALIYILGLLISTNPVATMIATEAILVSNQTLFYFTAPIYNNFTSNNVNIPLISPWIPFTVFAFGLAVVFLLMSIINVSRRENT
jgi:hypothetical protein